MHRLTPLILAAFFMAAPFHALARTNTIEVTTPARAWSTFLDRWDQVREGMQNRDTEAARQALEKCLESKWDGALGDLELPAMAVIRWAGDIYRQGDRETPARLAEISQKLAPDSVNVHLALARYHLGGGPVEPGKSIAHYLDAIKSFKSDFSMVHRAAGRVFIYPLSFFGLVGATLALISLARYGPLLAHDIGDFFPPDKLPAWMIGIITALVLLLPLAAGLSLWWLISWLLLVLSLYMKRVELVLAGVWFLFLLAAPFLVKEHAKFASARADRVLQAAIEVKRGVPGADQKRVLEEALEEDPENMLVRMSLAELLTRQGRFYKASALYKAAFDHPLTAQAAYNNVAQIYFAAGDYDSTYRALRAAMEKGPPQVEILYNLGRYFHESGQVLESEKQYKRARELFGSRIDRLTEKTDPHTLNRTMASMPVPWQLFWKRSLKGAGTTAPFAEGMWKKLMGRVHGTVFFAAAGACFLALILLRPVKRKWRLSYRCESCGRPVCLRCQRPAKDPSTCAPCYSVFRGEGGVDLKVKMQKRSEVQRFRDLWRRAGLITSLLVPGSGQMLLGLTGAGVLLLCVSALIGAGYLSRALMWPTPAPDYPAGVAAHGAFPLLIYIIFMIISIMVIRSRLSGWR